MSDPNWNIPVPFAAPKNQNNKTKLRWYNGGLLGISVTGITNPEMSLTCYTSYTYHHYLNADYEQVL